MMVQRTRDKTNTIRIFQLADCLLFKEFFNQISPATAEIIDPANIAILALVIAIDQCYKIFSTCLF